MIIAAGPHPAASTTTAGRPNRPATTVHRVASPRRNAPVDALASTEQLLRHRDALPAGHPDRATLRARVIEVNLPMAHGLARRYAGRGELFEDLAQVAALALIKAVDGYDSSRQVPFAGYAVPSILGALKRHFRDTAWAMRVPRTAQELGRRVAIATGDLAQRNGHPPATAELAAYLHVTADEVRIAVAAWGVYRLASLNTAYTGDVDAIDLIGGIDPRYDVVDDHLALRPLFAALPTRERRILTMRFYEHMSQTQIAAQIGLSQMHVSRLLRRALTQLRTAMPN